MLWRKIATATTRENETPTRKIAMRSANDGERVVENTVK
jgi:hypothetical protein